MSLNFSQPVSHAPRKKKKGAIKRAKPAAIDLVLEHITQHFAETGLVPTNRETAAAIHYHYQGTCLAWNQLADQGRLPAAILEARDHQRELARKPATCHLHSGKCTPETADKLYNLIKNDIEARIAFFELLRGNIRKDPT